MNSASKTDTKDLPNNPFIALEVEETPDYDEPEIVRPVPHKKQTHVKVPKDTNDQFRL